MPQIMTSMFNVLVGLVAPLAVLLYFLVKRRSLALPFLVGVLTFLCSQVLTRLPLMQLLATQGWYLAFAGARPALFALLTGLSAGLFEELGRFVAMTLMKRSRGWGEGMAFGLGHGGLEAALIGLNNLLLILLYQPLLLADTPFNIALAGIERIFAVMAHLGFSLMVMRAVAGKKPLWLIVAILLHAGLDAGIGLLSLAGLGIYGIEVFIALCGLGLLAFALWCRRAWWPNGRGAQEGIPNTTL